MEPSRPGTYRTAGTLTANPGPGNTGKDAKAVLQAAAATTNLRIITPTQSGMDRLAAVYAWNDERSRDRAIMVATHQDIDWTALKQWFENEGVNEREFDRIRNVVTEWRNQ